MDLVVPSMELTNSMRMGYLDQQHQQATAGRIANGSESYPVRTRRRKAACL